MIDIDFRSAGATDCPLGPDWFGVDHFDRPLYFAFTNTQLSAHLSLELEEFDYNSPWLGKFWMGYTNLNICQRLPLYQARNFFLLGKKADGSLYIAKYYSHFLKNLMSFADEHALLDQTLHELKKIYQFEAVIPVGYKVVKSYYWH